MLNGRLFGLFATVIILAILQGCSYVKPIPNQPLKQWDPTAGYRFRNLEERRVGKSVLGV